MEPNYSSLFNDIKVLIYVVLSRSTTFDGLYLFQPIDMAKEDIDLLVENLKARGAMKQLLLFLTGPADNARKEWKNVRILMIDEISHFSHNDFKKLDQKLKHLNERLV